MDPLAVASLADKCFQVISTLLGDFSTAAKRDATLSQNLETLQICYGKVEAFWETWGATTSDTREVFTDQVLWDESSSLRVHSILSHVLETTEQIQTLLLKIEPKARRSFLRRCAFWLREGSAEYDVAAIDDLIAKLTEDVDVGWAYYHAAAESQELLTSQLDGSIHPLPDDRPARQAKGTALALFDILRTSKDRKYRIHSVDLDLSGNVKSLSKQETLTNSSLPPLSFRLYIQSQEATEKWKQILVSGVDESLAVNPCKIYSEANISDSASDLGFVHVYQDDELDGHETLPPNEDYFKKLTESSGGQCFVRQQPELQEKVYLKIAEPLAPVLPSPHVEALQDLLTPRRNSSSTNFDGPLTITERGELAHWIVKYGFYTLGTPWASFLRIQNIYRMIGIGGEPRYVLSVTDAVVQPSNFSDSTNLAETSHLIQIGILLIEIGLQRPISIQEPDALQNWSNRIEMLAQVEKVMGSQYCRAAAFCLQRRHDLVQSQLREKFNNSVNEPWRSYSSEILGEYYEHVLKRIQSVHAAIDL